MLNNYIELITCAFMLFAFFLFFWLLSRIELWKSRYYLKLEKEKAGIFKELAFASSRILDEENTLIDYPNIAFYLSRVGSIVRVYGFDIKRISVMPLAKLPDYPEFGFSREGFSKEIFSLPEESSLLKLVFDCSDSFGRIYRIKHPFKYAYITFKKNQTLHILGLILNVLGIASKYLHKKIEKSLEEEVEERVGMKNLDCGFVSTPEPAIV